MYDEIFQEEQKKIEFDNLLSNNSKQNLKEELSELYHEKLLYAQTLKKELKEKIIGQDIAIDIVTKSLRTLDIKSESSPLKTFMFLGPSAVGKTYMAQTLASNLNGYKYLELNMTQYNKHQDGQMLFGTERGWNTETNGLITTFVKENSKTIIFFDEFEKAHTNIQLKLLSIFSEGYLHDNLGWDEDGDPVKSTSDIEPSCIETKVDFTNTIIIIGSNLVKNLYNNHNFVDSFNDNYFEAETQIIQELQTEMKIEEGDKVLAIVPEMLSRLSQAKMVLFNKLEFEDIVDISMKSFDKKMDYFKNMLNINIKNNIGSNMAIDLLILTFSPYMDIRRIQSKLYDIVFDKIDDFMIDSDLRYSDIKSIALKVDRDTTKLYKKELLTKIEDKSLLKELFRKNLTFKMNSIVSYSAKTKILSFAITNGSLEKVKKVNDYTGNGALLVDVPDTTFDDIIGHEKIKDRLTEILNLLKYDDIHDKFNTTTPKGMLLYGESGTGKTMLARALANISGLPFIQTTANDLIDINKKNMSTMKEIFNRAKEYAPAIIFIDEIDTIGSREKNGNSYLINELLTQIDGFSTNENIFIIAATNHKENLDPALLRAGRLELHIEVPTLDKNARRFFVKRILEKPCETNIDIEKLVTYTSNLNGSSLEKISNESSLYCIR
ncbi:MAG: AAA family ATPase, partial [Arcobacteraceae bacterium]|nr:AAA family ATPase [Arcobacteraceae bacterium]